jgi:proline racemase
MGEWRMTNIAQQLLEQFPDRLVTIDSHTAGEPTRLIVGGVPPIPGETVAEKRQFLMREWDHIRLQLTSEPRGHRDMIAALVTEPTTEGANFGLIYMDARRYPYLCGHATIGAVTTFIEAGAVEAVEPETTVIIDTPSGPAQATAHVQDGKVKSVTIRLAPSFVYSTDQPLDVPGLGRIQVDLVCVGGFFAMVSAGQIGLKLEPHNAGRLIELGMAIIKAANEQLTVRHPTRPKERRDLWRIPHRPLPVRHRHVRQDGAAPSPGSTGSQPTIRQCRHPRYHFRGATGMQASSVPLSRGDW